MQSIVRSWVVAGASSLVWPGQTSSGATRFPPGMEAAGAEAAGAATASSARAAKRAVILRAMQAVSPGGVIHPRAWAKTGRLLEGVRPGVRALPDADSAFSSV